MTQGQLTEARKCARSVLGHRLAGNWPPSDQLLLDLARTCLRLVDHAEEQQKAPPVERGA